jgi:type VI secretion system protein ImpA
VSPSPPPQPVLAFDKLLEPIPGDNPAGVDLRASEALAPLLYAIKDARQTARNLERLNENSDRNNPPAPADWQPVVEKGCKVLAENTKDLEVVSYLIEGLVRVHGFPGLRDGLRLARELVERFWDRLYPQPEEEGLADRVRPLANLNGEDSEGTLPSAIGRVPFTVNNGDGALSWIDHQMAQSLKRLTDPVVRNRRIAEGARTEDMVCKAVRDTPASFYQELVRDLQDCQAELKRLSATLDDRCGEQSPPSSAIGKALGDYLATVKDLARDKLEDKDPSQANRSPTPPDAPPAPGGAIRNRDEAFTLLGQVADFFRRTEPHTVVSYALDQVVRWGKMPLPELLAELIPEEGPRKNLFRQVGIRPPEPPPRNAPPPR